MVGTLLGDIFMQILGIIDETPNILFTWKQGFAQRVQIKYDAKQKQMI